MPDMSLEEATAQILATDPRFALGRATIRGVDLPVFANAPQSLREMLLRGRDGRDSPEFLIYEGERIGYEAFCVQTNRISRLLTDRFGVRPGDRVAIAMRNYPEYLSLFFGIANIGAVAVLINAWWTTEELAYGFDDSGAKLVFADAPRAERLSPFMDEKGVTLVGVRDAEAPLTLDALLADIGAADWPEVEIDPDSDFGILYSSGSTGHPKGVVLTHRGAISAIYSWLFSLQLPPLMAPADFEAPPVQPQVQLCATPLFHVTALHPISLTSVALGAKIVLMRKWDGEAALRLIREEKVTRFLGVPTMTADLKEAADRTGLEAPSLEALISGGAKRPAAQVAPQAARFPGAAMGSGWGMTETNAIGIGIGGPDYVARPDQIGRLYPPLQEMRIVDDAGREVGLGEIGELTVKSAANMRCYLNKPDATAEALRDGWLHTGDLAKIDADGYVTIVDRKKNIIIRGGENISGLEVEGAIHRHPDVAEAVAFPVPDPRLGEVVGAAIQAAPGSALTGAALRTFLADGLAGFKIPERIWWTPHHLPRGATDKLDRRHIAKECLNGALGREDDLAAAE